MHSLKVRLALAFVLVVLLAVGSVAILANRATTSAFQRYLGSGQSFRDVALADELAGYYQQRSSWDGVAAWLSSAVSMGHGRGARGMGGMAYVLADAAGVVVADTSGRSVGDKLSHQEAARGVPIAIGDERVGTLLAAMPMGNMGGMGQQEQVFLDQTNRAILLAGGLAALAATALGIWLASRLTSPLRELGHAAQRVASGDLSSRVVVRSADEIGALGHSFNQMAEVLEREESLRRQMIADIAHELRTPLTVIQGNLEALQDGVFPPTAENLGLLHDEALLLARLIRDLQDLALAEAGQLKLDLQPAEPVELLEPTLRRFQAQAAEQEVALALQAEGNLPPIRMDVQRMGQVLGNLLSNALRHTPRGGQITVRARWVGAHDGPDELERILPAAPARPFLLVSVSDTGEGISPETLEHVFDRFYRADRSRSRASGGAGLGLAIARGLVQAHGGEIGVTSVVGQGATFAFALPGTRNNQLTSAN